MLSGSFSGSGRISSLPAAARQPAVLVCAALAVAIGVLLWQNGRLRAEVRGLEAEVRSSAGRERDLEATVARQHDALRGAEVDLEDLRFQLAGVEMQLDGIDYFGHQVQQELGMPAAPITWSDEASSDVPQGDAGAQQGAEVERLSVARRRLAAGMSALDALLGLARASRANEALAAPAAPSGPPVEPEEPANWPARGRVTSPFGWRVFRGRPNYHTGIDVAVDYGTQVLATAPGRVVGSGWQPGYGWSVLVQHAGGYNTLYAHMSEAVVAVGDRLRRGDVVGLSGSSGNSTGPHLHYEIWKDGRLLDPRPLMDGWGGRRSGEG